MAFPTAVNSQITDALTQDELNDKDEVASKVGEKTQKHHKEAKDEIE